MDVEKRSVDTKISYVSHLGRAQRGPHFSLAFSLCTKRKCLKCSRSLSL